MTTLKAKTVLPIALVALAGVAALGLVAIQPTAVPQPMLRRPPLVQTLGIEPRDIELMIRAHGTVVPRTESELVSEVSGRIVWVSPSLAAGGFVQEGERLLAIEPGDYEVAVERAEAGLARAESQLQLAESHLARLSRLSKSGALSTADLDDALSGRSVAEANRREASAVLNQAQRDLARTQVLSPFVGRVRKKLADVGQYVTRGAPVARVYAVDYAEVRLPIPDDEAAFVDLPIDYRDEQADMRGPEVILRADFAGRTYSWNGRIVRTEGELDPKTRMIHAVARVEDPYARGDDPSRPPLAVGLFVEAEIRGRSFHDIVVLPRKVLRGGADEVVLVDSEGRLERRGVEVLRRESERVLIRAGLSRGERVCLTSPSIAVEGMAVRSVEAEDAAKPHVFATRGDAS